LAHVKRPTKLAEARMRRRILVAPQQLFEVMNWRMPIAIASSRRNNDPSSSSASSTSFDDELANLLERREGSVDAIVATFSSGEDATVAQAKHDLARHATLAILRAHCAADERRFNVMSPIRPAAWRRARANKSIRSTLKGMSPLRTIQSRPGA
jgi:hypothetical protein